LVNKKIYTLQLYLEKQLKRYLKTLQKSGVDLSSLKNEISQQFQYGKHNLQYCKLCLFILHVLYVTGQE